MQMEAEVVNMGLPCSQQAAEA
ncbi:hypothetical protein AERO8C_70555 [Aeromonas veronii]|uniref:Uncharacterized protein n=1 Tax=Aeromonas veronii TaxID=654 RepID=A0A653LBJ5_AERVE|nr:hypothetical protein AERO8C_70555 [Aeromonas veronii]